MALVMLPCEMPWWSMVHRKLADIQKCSTVDHLVEHMQKIHDTCNVSLDPDEDKRDCTIFFGLRSFMNNHISSSEKDHLLLHTIPNIARRAQELRSHRPARGMSFSLQQHTESAELQYPFVASLLANAFFSTFPKRTEKTHPTLQDFNFTHFFVDLGTSNSQRAKFQALMYYFDWLEKPESTRGSLKISRRVMTGRQWLTIEDWMECGVPLSGIEIKHEARIERSPPDVIQTIFASSRIGGSVLWSGNSQENIQLCTVPEALVTLLYVEALEDNETLYIEGGRQVARIMDARGRAIVELLEAPREISFNLMDAEFYDPAIGESQFEEDNILRELNKCLLAYRQHLTCAVFEPSRERRDARRLSPIGESGTNSPGDAPTMATIVIKQASSTKSSESSVRQQDLHFLSPSPSGLVVGPTASGRRGRFIVLGSSGECLPVTRRSLSQCTGSSLYSSCESSDDEFHSARDSVENSDDEDDEEFARKYSQELDTPEKRYTFAQRLREALQQSESYTESTEDSYACGISVGDSKNCDNAIRVRRAGSDGFVLQADSLDDTFYDDCLKYGNKMIGNEDQQKEQKNGPAKSRERKNSSKYSFSTELSSELEEVYDQFSKYGLWMEDPIGEKQRELDPRDVAVLRFAGSLLKRTLSESFVGVPLTEGCINSVGNPAEEASIQSYQQKLEKPILNSRSLSLELAKHKHRLAAQLVKKSLLGIGLLCRGQSKKHRKWSISLVHTLQTINCGDIVVKPPVEIAQILHRRKGNSNLRPIATGNWGCGRRHRGDVQLKFVIQWLAASVAGLPVLIYHTATNERLAKLDTVCRILLDRRWSVGRLARLMLRHAKRMLEEHEDEESQEFLEKLIGFPPPQSN